MKDTNRLLRLRRSMKQKRPKFLHQEHWKLKRFKKAPWRKPKGKRSKMRAGERAKPHSVSIGLRGPAKVRGYHPRGLPEITIYNVQDVERIPLKEEAKEESKTKKGKKKKGKKARTLQPEYVIRIASGVGTLKKIDILKAALNKNLYIANPTIHHVKITTMEEMESLVDMKDYIKTWYISDKVNEDEREDIEEKASELGIEVIS